MRRTIEARIIREFRRAYHQFSARVPDRESTVEWLSLMQHHGAPTRLLDFTYSVYVAAYFAVEDADSDSVRRFLKTSQNWWLRTRPTELFNS
jgi:hypothetical protein